MEIDKSIFKRYDFNMEEIIPKIQETIIEVYGEKNRSKIEDRLKTIYVNAYVTYDSISSDYYSKCSKINKQLGIKFLREMGIEVTKETEDNINKRHYGLNKEQGDFLKLFFTYSEFYEKGDIFEFDDEKLKGNNKYLIDSNKDKRCKILQKLGINITAENYDEVIQTSEAQNVMQTVKKAYEIAMKNMQEWNNFKDGIKDITNYIEQCKNVRQTLNCKYKKRYFEQIMPYVLEEEKSKIEEMLNSEGLKYEWEIDSLVDPKKMYSGDFLLESFSKENNEKANLDNYIGKNIREKRIKYFKLKGLDLGDDYIQYENSEEAIKIWPNEELVKSILEINDICKKENEKEFFLKTSNYEQCKENIEKFDFVLSDSFSIDFVKQNPTCISPNALKNEQGEYTNFNVLHFPIPKIDEKYRDIAFVHEILHVVELTMTKTSDFELNMKTGFDRIDEEIVSNKNTVQDDKEYEHNIRKYEILSENLHQWISMVITNKLHNKGIYIFDDPVTSCVQGYTSYEQINCITADFILEFGKDIIEGMISDDMQYIYNKVGQENLDFLNNIVVEYRKMPYYDMMYDVVNKNDTDLTKKRNELIADSKNIVNEMKKYKDRNESGYQISTNEIGKVTFNEPNENKVSASINLNKDKQEMLSKDNNKQKGMEFIDI